MTSLPMHSRVSDLKRRLQRLKDEAESVVSNTKSILDRGKALVVHQESIHDAETFLRNYPLAAADLDVLVNNLVRFNCELEIALSKCTDVPQVSSNNSSSCEFMPSITCHVETRSVFTNTELVYVNSLLTGNRDAISHVYKIEEGSILEMKHLLGDCPTEFWLGYYSNKETDSVHLKLAEHLKLGQCKQLVSLPSIGQYIIGPVFRGYVLSVYCERIVALDIDTGSVKFTSVSEAWEMEDEILNIPPQAICCNLWQFPRELEWCSELKLIFKKFMSNCDLVVSVKDIIPTVPPTFVVDVDAHEGTILNFNVSQWIMEYVIQGVEKLKSLDLSDSERETVLHEMDPYGVFCDENVEVEESILYNPCVNTSVSNDDEFTLQSDGNQNSSDTFGKETDNGISESPFIPISTSSCSFNSSSNISSSIVSSHRDEDIQSMIGSNFQPNHCDADLFNHQFVDTTPLPCDENSKLSHIFQEFEFRSSDGGGSVNDNVKHLSARVNCELEKGSFSEMLYVEGDNPWNFILSLNLNEEFLYLMKEIRERGKANTLKHFVEPPEINEFAIGKYNNSYFRARICGSLQESDDYFILDIDTGEHKVLNIFNIFVLEEKFAALPAKAISCSLCQIPREPPYWNSSLGELFRDVMQKNVLKVTVKDVINVSNSWNHLVQVKISSDVEFDLSEWFMVHVAPKLFRIKNWDLTGKDCTSAVKMLNPVNFYSKSIESTPSSYQEIRSLVLNRSTDSKLFSKWLRKPHAPNNHINLSSTSKNQLIVSDKTSDSKWSDVEPPGLLCSQEINKCENISNAVLALGSSDILTDFISTSDLKIGEKYYAYLSNILSPGEFYVHLVTEDNASLDKFQSELEEFYSEQIVNYKTKTEVKQLISNCCAVSYEGQWCRAKIIDWMDYSKNDVYVLLVDFGVYVSLPFCSIQYLKSDFCQRPLFALKCKMAQIGPPNNSNNWSEEAKQYFSSILDFSNVYTLYIEEFSGSGTTAVFLSVKGNAESINDMLVNEGVAVSLKPSISNSKSDKSHAVVYPPAEAVDDMFSSGDEFDDGLEYNSRNVEDIYFEDNSNNLPSVGEDVTVVVTELVSLCSFYGVVNVRGHHLGRFSDTNDVLQQMSEKIKRAVDSGNLRTVKNYIVGMIVVAMYSRDNVWYRARLLTPVDDNGYAEVFFLDYGNTDLVSKKNLREISNEFSSLPFQAVRFFVSGVDLTTFKGNAHKKGMKIMSSLLGKYVNVRIVKIVNDDIIVDLFSGGQNICLKLLSIPEEGNDDSESGEI